MLRLLILTVLLSLLCYKSCVGRTINADDTTQELGRQSSLLVHQGTPRPHNEEVKQRQINRRSIFIAPAFSGTSHLPDCAEGYMPDSMGGCVKLVRLNHTAQLDFLLKRLNAMYGAPVTRSGYDNHSASDSSSARPLQVSTLIQSDNLHHEEGDLKLSASNITKYEKTNKSENSSVPTAKLSATDEEQLLSATQISIPLSKESGQSLTEPTKAPNSHHGGPGSRPCLASGIYGGQSGDGARFIRVLRFLLPDLLFHQLLHPHNHQGRYNRPVVAALPSGPRMDSTPIFK
jgi:hypothetical protein